jgi:hypothetical protein
MDEIIARLRTHQRNIDRYQDLLSTRLTETELHFIERRLSEERFAMARLQFMSPPHADRRSIDLPATLP